MARLRPDSGVLSGIAGIATKAVLQREADKPLQRGPVGATAARPRRPPASTVRRLKFSRTIWLSLRYLLL
jgi:hypothetical protein